MTPKENSVAESWVKAGIKVDDEVYFHGPGTRQRRTVVYIGTTHVVTRDQDDRETVASHWHDSTYEKIEPFEDWPDDAKELLRLASADRDRYDKAGATRMSFYETTQHLYNFVDKLSPPK